ncbi:MAG: hypothetical protein A2Y36_15045 [Treponema sp. GWA1_62_8]|nr:MAG: hypothetical protein A2Y36_15045 [Treponema sp. GWA1_62_8]
MRLVKWSVRGYTVSMPSDPDDKRLFELVQFSIHDVGRSVDLARLESAAADAISSARRSGRFAPLRRDTPTSLSLPRPLIVPLAGADAEGLGRLSANAKIYEDGAITIVVRTKARLLIEDLAPLSRERIVSVGASKLNLDEYSALLFDQVMAIVSFAIVDPVSDENRDKETYLAFCLLECPEGPSAYIAAHRGTVAVLLVGEEDPPRLHESQIAAALGRPFSYRPDDLAVFDMDRCFIVDPRADYEDILLIAEHANYRLLELRALDRLLDFRLDEAEKDLTAYGLKRIGDRKSQARLRGGAPRRKFARIQALRFEALFVLENLENSAKIIGDYYLGQIYDRLCAVFNTDGWSRSVERRLDVLSSVYDMAKTDSAERRTQTLEITFIIVCIVLPLVQIWQALVLN